MTNNELLDELTGDWKESGEYEQSGTCGCWFWGILLLFFMGLFGYFDFVAKWLSTF